MKHLANRLKIAALSAAIMLPMIPSIANAEIVIDDAVSASQVKEDLVTVEFTPLEKKLMNGKGFDYRYDLGGDYDYSDGRIPLNEYTMYQINDWAKTAYYKSGAADVKGERNKARLMAAYLTTYYPYDSESIESEDVKTMWKASSLTSLPFRAKSACMGYSYMLVRMLDILGIESYQTMACMKDPDGTNPGYHSVVRAHLDGKWTTIETTGTIGPNQLHQDVMNGYNMDNEIFPKAYQVGSEEALYQIAGQTKHRYEIVVDKEIEDYLANNNFIIYGY